MSSVSLRDVQEILAAEVIPVVLNAYEREPVLYPTITRVITPQNAAGSFPIWGVKGTSMSGMPEPVFRDDHEDIEVGAMAGGYTWYGRIRSLAQAVVLSQRELDSLSRVQITDRILQSAESWGPMFAIAKEKYVAGMFQKGSLTAGSLEYFDGSSKDYGADPYPKFIYDGLPWFDTAHTQKHGSSTFSNHSASLSLTYDNLQTVINTQEHTNAYDETGQAIINPMDTLLVPHGQRFTAGNILQSIQEPGSAQNDTNVLRNRLQVLPWRYLSDAASASAWWVGRRGAGIRVYDTGAPVMQASEIASNKTIKITAESFFGALVDDFRPWYCANKAAS